MQYQPDISSSNRFQFVQEHADMAKPICQNIAWSRQRMISQSWLLTANASSWYQSNRTGPSSMPYFVVFTTRRTITASHWQWVRRPAQAGWLGTLMDFFNQDTDPQIWINAHDRSLKIRQFLLLQWYNALNKHTSDQDYTEELHPSSCSSTSESPSVF